MRVIAVAILTSLGACGTWPDAGGPPLERRSSDWPVLLPISDLIETDALPPAENADAARLAARAAALQARADILRADAGNADEMEALRARLR